MLFKINSLNQTWELFSENLNVMLEKLDDSMDYKWTEGEWDEVVQSTVQCALKSWVC